MLRSSPVDGFQLTYDRAGTGDGVVLLHGWPGDRQDYRDVTPLLTGCTAVAPDLRGFGESDKHPATPADAYSADAQARSVVRLMDELGLRRAVVAGPARSRRRSRGIAPGLGRWPGASRR